MSKFSDGDKVVIAHDAHRYDTFVDWFRINRPLVSIEWMVKYRYDDDSDTIGAVCTVLHHAPHPNDFETMLYLVSDDSTGYVYLIGERGLEPAKIKMTIAEIEKALGYRIEIVEENK